MQISEALLQENRDWWQRWLPHPFTRAVAENTVNPQVFARWLAQDYLFVREGMRFLGVLLGKAPPHLMDPLADTIATWKDELGLFRQQAGDQGVSLDVAPLGVTRAYIDFLLAVGHQEPFAVGWAVLFGVEGSYHDAWRWVRDHAAADHPYAPWFTNWGSDGFGDFVRFLAGTLDDLVAPLPPQQVAAVRARFRETARLELWFWEMALHGDPL